MPGHAAQQPSCVCVQVSGRRGSKRHKGTGGAAKGKGSGWVLKKKEQMRQRGYESIPQVRGHFVA